MTILDYFPADKTPRPAQASVLLEIERVLPRVDVMVVVGPTAFGKTEAAATIGRWLRNALLVEPQNILVDQVVARYPNIPALYRKNAYPCTIPEHEPGCACQYRAARDRIAKAPFAVMNYWSAAFAKMHRKVMIFDEAHKVVDMLQGFADLHLNVKQLGIPRHLSSTREPETVGDLLDWMLPRRNVEVINEAIERLTMLHREHVVIRDKGYITLAPIAVSQLRYLLWPKIVTKTILMSATIGPRDVKELGLDHLRVHYIEAESPIPAANRPLIYMPSYSLAHRCVDTGLPACAAAITKLLDKHPEKGLIHIPYNLASRLQVLCPHPRLLYHTKFDKAAKLQAFRDAPPDSGTVLVASGLYEGIDLPYDAARWQLIAKVPYDSLGDPRTAERARLDPVWYRWQTIKRLLQAYGRIVRAPDDTGTTYLMDSTFDGLYRQSSDLFPNFVRAAYRKVSK